MNGSSPKQKNKKRSMYFITSSRKKQGKSEIRDSIEVLKLKLKGTASHSIHISHTVLVTG